MPAHHEIEETVDEYLSKVAPAVSGHVAGTLACIPAAVESRGV
jgi:hypothetical protein